MTEQTELPVQGGVTVHCFFGCGHTATAADGNTVHARMEDHYYAKHRVAVSLITERVWTRGDDPPPPEPARRKFRPAPGPAAAVRAQLDAAAAATLDGTLTAQQAADTALAALAAAIRADIPARYGPTPGSPGLALNHLADQLERGTR